MAERSLRDLFHLVQQLLPEEQEIKDVAPDTPVSDALKIMRETGFSRLPVRAGSVVLGVFSYRSLALGLLNLPPNVKDPMSLTVEEFTEQLRFASTTDELPVLLEDFDVDDAVLIGVQDRLLAIVTTIDA